MEKRIEKLAEHIRSSQQALQDQRQLWQDLQSDVGSSKDRVHEIQKQLDDVTEQLGDARTDKHEDARRKKKQEIVEIFKSNYPGVYDRMINMCQPIHKRYNVAITKYLGKYMEAIVVDTKHTGRQCVKYLEEQMLEPETFLPLDYLQTIPVKEWLRDISEPKGVKLMYDVLHFEPQAIVKAVMFATNNALVCETPEDAMKVAYELGERYDVVSLDGTYYQKSGIISGGSLDLARKAKRWDEKHMAQLKAQKLCNLWLRAVGLLDLQNKSLESIHNRLANILQRSCQTLLLLIRSFQLMETVHYSSMYEYKLVMYLLRNIVS